MARFAHAPLGKLLLAQFIVALFTAAVTVWFLASTWAPLLDEAVTRLPQKGEIRKGRLHWGGAEPTWLAEGRYLSIIVTTNPASKVGVTADLQVELRSDEWRLASLFGYVPLIYPDGWVISLNKPEVEPRWGAWRPMLLTGAGIVSVLWLFLIWNLLSILYAAPVKLIALYLDRELSWLQAHRMACAALLPGAVFLSLVILLYGIVQIPLVLMLTSFALHILMGWVYIGFAPFALPKVATTKNPFSSDSKKSKGKGNPFAK